MSALKLHTPVYTLEKKLLLPEGTALTKKTIDGLVLSKGSTSHKTYHMMRTGSVKKDLLYLLSRPPFDLIFSNRDITNDVLNIMKNVRLISPCLESLEYFKEKDFYTYRHILMVFALSTLLARELFSSYKGLDVAATSGPTHDFGKVCIPLHILQKNTPITRKERDILRNHTAIGYVLLSYYLNDSRKIASRVARDHHERRNGIGYPRGIRQRNLLVETVAVSDIYDALISPRPYRPISYDNRTALEEITGMAERSEISWVIVKALIAYNRKIKRHYSETRVSPEKRGAPPPGNIYGMIADE